FVFLERFVARVGHARVPAGHVEVDFRLGTWVKQQRRVQGESGLTKERTARLEALPGWTWHTADAAWDEALQPLLPYLAPHRHTRVPQSFSEGDFARGKWGNANRQAYKRGRLSAERSRRLEELKGWSW